MMLYKRQKLLLDLVHAAGGELAATDLQKRQRKDDEPGDGRALDKTLPVVI